MESISRSTLSRWFRDDALKPWTHHTWLFPRDPNFREKAGRVLDLYHGEWEGEPLGEGDYVVCADEKSQLQILRRRHETASPRPGHPARVEFEYERGGTITYQAVMDIGTGEIVGDQFPSGNCKSSFDTLVATVMHQEPYHSADRVFCIIDNGPAHHPATFGERLTEIAPHAQAVHLPIHASWLDQIELYFSILDRKALTPRDVNHGEELKERIRGFRERYNETATPFKWNFSREDLNNRRKAVERNGQRTYETVY